MIFDKRDRPFTQRGIAMKRTGILILACVSMISCGVNEEARIEDCFKTYLTAVLNSNGKEAAARLDSRTREYYRGILDKALHLSAEETKKLSFLNKVNVLTARHAVPNELLVSMKDDDFLVYGVDEGLVGKETAVGCELAEITIAGDMATTKLKSDDTIAPIGFNFYKEGGEWKLNLTEFMKLGNIIMMKQVMDSGMEEDDFLLFLLGQLYDKKPDASIWDPVVPGGDPHDKR